MKKTLAAVSLVALLSCAAFAEVGQVTASILPGAAIPAGGIWANDSGTDPDGAGDYNFGYNASFALAIAADYQFTDMLAGGLELGDSFQHKLKQTPSDYSGGNARLIQVTPYIKAMAKKMDKWTPYGIFGMGLYSLNVQDVTHAGTTASSGSTGYFGFNVGGGMMYDIAKNIQLGVDLRWHHVFAKTADGDTAAINNITPSIKASYLF